MEDRFPSQRPHDDPQVAAGQTAHEAADSGGDPGGDAASDAAIRQVLFDVPVPEGLLARLAVLPDRAPQRDLVATAIASAADESSLAMDVAKKEDSPRAKRHSRRTAIGVSLALAAAACLAGGVVLYRSGTDFDDWNRETLARRAIAWTLYLEQDPTNREAWRPIGPERTTRTLGAWLRVPPEAMGEYRLSGTHARRFRGEVYRFGSAERSQAMLFVVDAATLPDALPPSPLDKPHWTSEGFAVGMWRRGDKLYVLAVRGDAGDYARLVRRQDVA